MFTCYPVPAVALPRDRNTALHMATGQGHLAAAEALLEAGAAFADSPKDREVTRCFTSPAVLNL